jgi:hypothetical protein
VADRWNPSVPFTPSIERLRSNEFDASIFDRVALPPAEDRSDPEEESEDDEPASQREGLPPGFSMRHDAHYVEELVSSNRASRVSTIPTDEMGGPRNGRRVREAGPALPMADACTEIGQSLDAIGACLHLFSATARPAPERVALDLMSAEVCRATWLVQALSLLDEEVPVAKVPVDLGPVVGRVVRGLTPGCCHAQSTLEAHESPRDLRARGDERLLTVAVAGMAMALQAVAEQVEAAVIGIRVLQAADRAIVEATQETVRMPATWRARFLDLDWTDRPGGRRVAVALAASLRVAEWHCGTLTMADTQDGGCRLVLSLPRA